VGINAESSRKALGIAERHEGVFAAAGIQPSYSADADEQDWNEIRALAAKSSVVAVGETGLDAHYDWSPIERQKEMFERHLALSVELGKPVIVHCRKASDMIMEMLKSAGRVFGVQHCFSERQDYARKLLDLGFYISFTGIISREGYKRLKATAAYVPADRLLIETDCPYMLPVGPVGVERNEPAFVSYTLAALAGLRGEDPEDLARTTTGNACRLFGVQNTSEAVE